MNWLSKLFGKSNGVELPSSSTSFQDMDAAPKPIRLKGTDMRATREAIHSAAMKTAKAYGVPPLWLTFEVVTMADSEKAYFQLQVVIQHWDEYLASHSYAFERAVMKRLLADNKRIARAVRAVLWRTAYDAGCPYEDMPDPHSWTTEAIKKRVATNERAAMYMLAPKAVTQPSVAHSTSSIPPHEHARSPVAANKFDGLLDDDRYAKTRPMKPGDGFPATEAFGKSDSFAPTEPMGLGKGDPG
jgi:hypothetical protein